MTETMICTLNLKIWTATWQNQPNEYAPSEDRSAILFVLSCRGSYGPYGKVYSADLTWFDSAIRLDTKPNVG